MALIVGWYMDRSLLDLMLIRLSFLELSLPGAIGPPNCQVALSAKLRNAALPATTKGHDEMHAHEVHAHEVHAYEVHTHEVHAHEVHAHEVHAHEMHTREVHAHEVHAGEIHAYEMRAP